MRLRLHAWMCAAKQRVLAVRQNFVYIRICISTSLRADWKPCNVLGNQSLQISRVLSTVILAQ
jgi:hypothetical protein